MKRPASALWQEHAAGNSTEDETPGPQQLCLSATKAPPAQSPPAQTHLLPRSLRLQASCVMACPQTPVADSVGDMTISPHCIQRRQRHPAHRTPSVGSAPHRTRPNSSDFAAYQAFCPGDKKGDGPPLSATQLINFFRLKRCIRWHFHAFIKTGLSPTSAASAAIPAATAQFGTDEDSPDTLSDPSDNEDWSPPAGETHSQSSPTSFVSDATERQTITASFLAVPENMARIEILEFNALLASLNEPHLPRRDDSDDSDFQPTTSLHSTSETSLSGSPRSSPDALSVPSPLSLEPSPTDHKPHLAPTAAHLPHAEPKRNTGLSIFFFAALIIDILVVHDWASKDIIAPLAIASKPLHRLISSHRAALGQFWAEI